MTTRALRQPSVTFRPATVLTVLGLGLLAVCAVFAAVGLDHALALLLGMLFVIPAVLNLAAAVIIWVPFAFLPPLGFVGAAPTAGAAVILLCWLPSLRARGAATRALLTLHRRTIAVALLLLIWLTVSVSWAFRPENGLGHLWQWWLAGVAFLVSITTISTPRQARLFVVLLLVGAVVSALIGIFGQSLSTSSNSLALAAADRQRLGSLLDDPNYVAAGLVVGIVLATALMRPRHTVVNLVLVACMGLLTVSVAATESRGALVAAGVAAIAAVFFYRGRRAQVLVLLATVGAVAAVWFSLNPHAWHRISQFDSSGTGRTALWTVAWRITEDHPVTGVGLDNFVEQAPKYTREPGKLDLVHNIAEKPHVAHNVYLQFLAETGFVGLTLFLLLLIGCMRAAWRAGLIFDLKGDRDMAALARGCLVAIIAFAAASFFISDGNDPRFWLLLALGPIMLGVAVRLPAPTGAGAPPDRGWWLPRGTGRMIDFGWQGPRRVNPAGRGVD
jgi:O-antigen ligase